jgi:hypothetical protein
MKKTWKNIIRHPSVPPRMEGVVRNFGIKTVKEEKNKKDSKALLVKKIHKQRVL